MSPLEPESDGPVFDSEAERLIHELTVHQVELELQNEQLRESRADVVMPNIGGRQLAEALRTRWPLVKLLYMSGYVEDAVLRYGVVESLTVFLQKPFSLAQLAWKVCEALDSPVASALGVPAPSAP